jgi:hypothetical protein
MVGHVMKGMTVRQSSSIVRLPIVAALVLAALIIAGVAGAQPSVTVVMSSLDNPRGLAFAPNGALFVAEAGRGGAPCPGTMGLNCYGLTGAVKRLWHGHQDRVATGLVSARCAGARAARRLDAGTG